MFRQSRTVCCIFYDLEDINLFIDSFGFADFQYAYIYHDKDINVDGSQKESHYHFFGNRKSPITEQSLKNFAKKCKQNLFFENLKSNQNAFIDYMIHSNNIDKYQYDKSSIIANFDIEERIIIDNKINPSEIISLYENGFTTFEIIKRFPKLIYSISNLQRFEKLVFRERYKEKTFDDTKIKTVPTDCLSDVF